METLKTIWNYPENVISILRSLFEINNELSEYIDDSADDITLIDLRKTCLHLQKININYTLHKFNIRNHKNIFAIFQKIKLLDLDIFENYILLMRLQMYIAEDKLKVYFIDHYNFSNYIIYDLFELLSISKIPNVKILLLYGCEFSKAQKNVSIQAIHSAILNSYSDGVEVLKIRVLIDIFISLKNKNTKIDLNERKLTCGEQTIALNFLPDLMPLFYTIGSQSIFTPKTLSDTKIKFKKIYFFLSKIEF